jgi:hypothetical protein
MPVCLGLEKINCLSRLGEIEVLLQSSNYGSVSAKLLCSEKKVFSLSGTSRRAAREPRTDGRQAKKERRRKGAVPAIY